VTIEVEIEIEIDTERCTGHGRCYAVASDVFESDDDGYGVVRATKLANELLDAARRGASNCPEDAITIKVVEDP
jgi:ferredoxin